METQRTVDGNGTMPPRDAEGFLVSAADWTHLIGEKLAIEAGLALTDAHWRILEAARKEFAASGASPGLRKLSKADGVPIKAFYDLFPDGPAKKIARIAGLPKPKSCL
jgi:TusE/DsrC/DsvC family sulfur relay protein